MYGIILKIFLRYLNVFGLQIKALDECNKLIFNIKINNISYINFSQQSHGFNR